MSQLSETYSLGAAQQLTGSLQSLKVNQTESNSSHLQESTGFHD